MTRICKQENVAYSANEMYSLVNDIAAYPEFLPWCAATSIIEKNDDALIASVSIAIGKLKQTFTTANTMQPDNTINMRLVEGPFKELTGRWVFTDEPDGGSTVSLDMQFEFKSKIIKHTLGTAFHKIIDSLVDAFIDRARKVYGER